MAATLRLYFTIFIIAIKIYNTNASVISNIVIDSLEDYDVYCKERVCLMKCCPDDLYVGYENQCVQNNDTSLNSSLSFDEVVLYKKDIKKTNKRLRNEFFLVPSELLGFAFDSAYELSSLANFYLMEDGTLMQELRNSYDRWTHLGRDQMCIDYVLPDNSTIFEHGVRFWVILPEQEMYESNTTFVATASLISSVFLIIVLVVYSMLPELRNLCGLILMAYVASLLGAFVMLATLFLIAAADEHTDGICLAFTTMIYFFFLSSFCWMNVMSFDIWWTFRGYAKARPIHRRGESFKFSVYCIFSWGLPAVMTIFMVAVDFIDLTHVPWFITPQILSSGCFLGGGGKFVYLYSPMLIVIVINWMFFLMTAFNIWRLSRGTAVLDSPAAGNPSAHRTHRHRFMLYLKLSVIMGVSWVLEVVSFLAPQYSVWYITDAYNLLIGVAIFLIFVCKKKIFHKLRKRLRASHKQWRPSFTSRSNSCSSDSDNSQDTTTAICSNPTGVNYYKR